MLYERLQLQSLYFQLWPFFIELIFLLISILLSISPPTLLHSPPLPTGPRSPFLSFWCAFSPSFFWSSFHLISFADQIFLSRYQHLAANSSFFFLLFLTFSSFYFSFFPPFFHSFFFPFSTILQCLSDCRYGKSQSKSSFPHFIKFTKEAKTETSRKAKRRWSVSEF